MEEAPKVQIETKVDPTLFRSLQQLAPQASDVQILREVYEDAKVFSLGGQQIDKKLVDFVEQWQELTTEPFSVEYFKAREVYEQMKDDFKKIDRYIVSKLKEANQKTTVEAYEAFTKKLEKALGLTEHSETMHRITQILKFIDNGNERLTTK